VFAIFLATYWILTIYIVWISPYNSAPSVTLQATVSVFSPDFPSLPFRSSAHHNKRKEELATKLLEDEQRVARR
jgi:hypothetical protein